METQYLLQYIATDTNISLDIVILVASDKIMYITFNTLCPTSKL